MTETPKFARVSTWCKISDMSRTATYRAIAAGNLKASKLGSNTMIDVEHGLEWLRSLPAAEFKAIEQVAPLP